MSTRHAIVKNDTGLVEDFALWDGASGWSPPEGRSAVAAPEEADIGDQWDGARFIPKPVPEPEPLPREMLVREAVDLKARINAANDLAATLPDAAVEAQRLTGELDAVIAQLAASP